MPAQSKKAVIIGCGVAGPALALSLQQAGIESEIFEAQEAVDDDAGLFHYLSPNGMNVFHTLGIYDKIKKQGYDCHGIVHYNEKGKRIGGIDEKDEEKEYGANSIFIKRGDLTKTLREEVIAKKINLHFGKKLQDIKQDDKVTVHFEDGTTAQGDFLVGCDGIHSRTRRIVMPDAPEPSYANLVVSGGYTSAPIKNKEKNTIHSNYCKKAFLAYFILPDGQIWWWNGMSFPQEQSKNDLEQISNKQWQQNMIELYSDDTKIIRDIVSSDENEFMKYPIHDMPSLQTWHTENVCLIGDAAHATSPTNGQGAALALEDALMLAKCFRDVSSTKNAFAKFEQLRKKRVEKIVKMGRTIGEGYFVTSPIKKWFRNTMITVTLAPLLFKRMKDFFYGYNVEWNKKLSS